MAESRSGSACQLISKHTNGDNKKYHYYRKYIQFNRCNWIINLVVYDARFSSGG